MRQIIFNTQQKESLQVMFNGIVYGKFQTHFEFIEIKNNKWILPETVLQSIDINSFIDKKGKRVDAQKIIDLCEIREITENEKQIIKP